MQWEVKESGLSLEEAAGFLPGASPPEDEDESTFIKALETLGIPLEMAMGGLEAAFRGEDVVEGIKRGPERDTSGSDVLGAMGMEEGKLRSGLGFAADVVLDPLNLLALGPGLAMTKALSRAARLAEKASAASGMTKAYGIARSTKLGTALADSGNHVLRKTFSPTAGLPAEEKTVVEAIRGGEAAVQLSQENARSFRVALTEHGVQPSILDRVTGATGDQIAIIEDLPEIGNVIEYGKEYGISKEGIGRVITDVIESAGGRLKDAKRGSEQVKRVLVANHRDLMKANPNLRDDSHFVEGIRSASKAIHELMEVDLKRSRAAGIPQRRFAPGRLPLGGSDEMDVAFYMPHMRTEEFYKKTLSARDFALYKRGDDSVRTAIMARDSGVRTEWRGYSARQLNDLGREGKAPGYDGVVFDKILHDDPFTLLEYHQMSAAKNAIWGGVLDDLAKSAVSSALIRVGVLRAPRRHRPIAYKMKDIPLGGISPEKGLPFAQRGRQGEVTVRGLKNLGWRTVDPLPFADEAIKKQSRIAQDWSDILWRDEHANMLDRHIKGYLEGEAGHNPLLAVFDELQNTWKALTLAVRPAFHTRNVVGNFMNNSLGLDGVNPLEQIRLYQKAASLQISVLSENHVVKRAAKAAGIKPLDKITTAEVPWLKGEQSTKEFLEDARELGIFSGQYGADIDLKLAGPEKKGMGLYQAVAKSKRSPVRMGLDVGTAIEDNARLMHYLAKLSQGDSKVEAALSVKKYLFDYTDLTKFEKRVLKRLMPFYTWTRKNLPLQATSMVLKPYKYSRVHSFITEVEKGAGEDLPLEDKLLPEFIRDNVGIRWRRDERGNPEYMLLGGWLPQVDLAKVSKVFDSSEFSNRLDPIMDLMTPFLMKPIEQFTGYSFFKDGKMESFDGEKGRFLGLHLRKKHISLLKSLILLNEADRIINVAYPNLSDKAPQSILSAAGQLGLGVKSYPLEWAKSMRRHFYRTQAELRDLTRKGRRAVKFGDVENIPTVLELIEKKRQELIRPAALLGKPLPKRFTGALTDRSKKKKEKKMGVPGFGPVRRSAGPSWSEGY